MTLFTEIDAHLERMRERARFVAAMTEVEWQAELWDSIRPFVRGPDDTQAAYTFMAAMLRQRARD